jgi:hypothetical protein
VAGRDATHPDDRDGDPSLAWLGAAGRSPRTLAEIWATVELERALADLGHTGPGGDDPWSRRDGAVLEDPLLGARVAVVATGDDGARIAVAEPSTEGRLAATLARHGEGPAGRYVESPVRLEELRALAAAAGVTVSRAENGPFGPSVLVVASVTGPHLILVDPGRAWADRAAVPSRP